MCSLSAAALTVTVHTSVMLLKQSHDNRAWLFLFWTTDKAQWSKDRLIFNSRLGCRFHMESRYLEWLMCYMELATSLQTSCLHSGGEDVNPVFSGHLRVLWLTIPNVCFYPLVTADCEVVGFFDLRCLNMFSECVGLERLNGRSWSCQSVPGSQLISGHVTGIAPCFAMRMRTQKRHRSFPGRRVCASTIMS